MFELLSRRTNAEINYICIARKEIISPSRGFRVRRMNCEGFLFLILACEFFRFVLTPWYFLRSTKLIVIINKCSPKSPKKGIKSSHRHGAYGSLTDARLSSFCYFKREGGKGVDFFRKFPYRELSITIFLLLHNNMKVTYHTLNKKSI